MADESKSPASEPKSSPRGKIAWVAAGIVLLGAAMYWGIPYYLYWTTREATDDAFIDAHFVRVSPRVAGHVFRVLVTDNQAVKHGDLLVELDPRDFEAQLAEARAALDVAIAEARPDPLPRPPGGPRGGDRRPPSRRFCRRPTSGRGRGGRRGGGGRAVSAAGGEVAREGTAGEEWHPRHNPWLIAFAVMLPTFMEVLDTSVANVALDHIAGSLGATAEESSRATSSRTRSSSRRRPGSEAFSGESDSSWPASWASRSPRG